MRVIPVDVQVFAGWMCVNPPEPKIGDPATGEVKKDREGNTLYVVAVVAMRGKDSSVIQVTVPGEPKGLLIGMPLRLIGLEAVPWDVDGRSGVSFRSSAVVPAAGVEAPVAGRGPGRGGDAG